MPNKHRPGYHREWQALRRRAIARLIERHRPEFEAIVIDLRDASDSAEPRP